MGCALRLRLPWAASSLRLRVSFTACAVLLLSLQSLVDCCLILAKVPSSEIVKEILDGGALVFTFFTTDSQCFGNQLKS